jgi:hypothetical protein
MQLLRLAIPLRPKLARSGNYIAETTTSQLRPQSACGGGRAVRLTIAGRISVDASPSVYTAAGGDELRTVSPSRRAHVQHISEDSLILEMTVPAAIAQLARRLSGRNIPCRLDFVGERTNRRMCTRRGEFFGLDSFLTSFSGVDAVTLDQGDYEATATVI